MSRTSEGYEETGLPPNPAVTADELDPRKFDPQTYEIIMRRLTKALALDPRADLAQVIDAIGGLQTERTRLLEAARNIWHYFHKRFQGLQCGLNGTWEQAINELIGFVNKLQADLNQKTMEIDALKGELAQNNNVVPIRPPSEDVAIQACGQPFNSRSATLESVPELKERLFKLEQDFLEYRNWSVHWHKRARKYFDAQSKPTPEGSVPPGE